MSQVVKHLDLETGIFEVNKYVVTGPQVSMVTA